MDIWLYFLRFAEKIDTEALLPALQQPVILRAVEELKMLTQTDMERERYEARRKAQMDRNTVIWFERLAGAIHAYETVLQRPQTPDSELEAMSADGMTRLAEELKKQVMTQR